MSAPARIHSRLSALERHRCPQTGFCPECGGPRPGQSLFVLVTETGAPRWGACGTCGLALREDGRAMSAAPLARHGPHYEPLVFEPDRWWMYDAV